MFSVDGRTAALGGFDNTMVLLDLARLIEFRRDPIGEACRRAGGPIDASLWTSYAPGFDYPERICSP